jgi:hypothetical protein
MKNEDQGLIRSVNEISQATSNLELLNNFILNRKSKIIRLLIKMEELNSGFLSQTVSSSGCLSESFIERWKHIIDWDKLSWNKNLDWKSNLILAHFNSWDKEGLGYNKSINWSEDVFKKVSKDFGKSQWRNLSKFENLPWNIETLNSFSSNLDWRELSGNEFLPWSSELIQAFESKWDWHSLAYNKGIKWNYDLIAKFRESVDHSSLLEAGNFDLSIEIIEDFFNPKWITTAISHLGRLTPRTIKHYEDKLDFSKLSANYNIEWSQEIIDLYKEKWDWEKLSKNVGIKFNESIIIRFEDKLNLEKILNSNYAFSIDNISEKLIERYKSQLDWAKLSGRSEVIWSEELINKYADRWDWDALSHNWKITWSEELIEKYSDKLNWSSLVYNDNISWSDTFIKKHLKNWNQKDAEKLLLFRRGRSIELMKLFKEYIGGEYIKSRSSSTIEFSLELVEMFIESWDYKKLSRNEVFYKELIKELSESDIEELFTSIYAKERI